jgi:hypothetical protein
MVLVPTAAGTRALRADGRNAITEFDGKNDGKNNENRDIANLRKLTGALESRLVVLSIEKSGALTRLLSTTCRHVLVSQKLACKQLKINNLHMAVKTI